MEYEVKVRLVLEKPTSGVDFGLQKGKGNNYQTIQKQRSVGKNLTFEFSVKVKIVDNTTFNFLGIFAQGPANERFFYIDIGTYAGQQDSSWGRRLKVPFRGISFSMIQSAIAEPGAVIETVVPGTGKDGGPNCGTVKPFDGWQLK